MFPEIAGVSHEGQAGQTSATLARRRVWLDFALVACFLLIPHSFFLYMSSSEFGASPLKRLPLFLLPGVLLALKLTRTNPRPRSQLDPVVVLLWLGVLAQGITMAMLHTEYPANTLSIYAQYLYWLALVGIFVASVGPDEQPNILELIRRYFAVVAVVAWGFALAYALFGQRLPHSAVVMPDPQAGALVLAQNYFVTLAYSAHSLFGWMVPRFTFLYREPRILGMHLTMGIILQIGYLRAHWRLWTAGERRRGAGVLLLLIGTLFWTHSLNGYIVAALLGLFLLANVVMRGAFWRSFRAIYLSVIALGVSVLAAAFILIGRSRDLSALVDAAVQQQYLGGDPNAVSVYQIIGKNPAFIASYATQYLTGPRGLVRFPFGTGIMNLDSPRYMSTYGVPTTQGGTLLLFFAQNAGFAGLIALVAIAWRLLGRMRRLVRATDAPEIRYACLLGGFLLVVSINYVDILSMSPFAVLVYGAIMNLRPPA